LNALESRNLIPFPGGRAVLEPEPELEPVEITISQWCQEFRYLEGRPIRFEQQPWIVPMQDCLHPWQVFRTGRQVAKSTTLVNKKLAYCCNIPFFRTMYVAPTQKQVRIFSNDRLRPAIHFSPDISSLFFDRRFCQDQVHNRSFTNSSKITLVSCFNDADSARGNSTDFLGVDEIQDILLENIPVLEECLSRSEYDYRLYCGTPKTHDTALELYFEKSTQNEWLVRCDHCGGGDVHFWNILDERNIGPEGLICKKCGQPLDWGIGEWVARHPFNRDWVGWHVSQLMCVRPRGWVEWDKILEKYNRYKRYLFFNEVLGVPFDLGAKPVTIDQIKACCLPEYRMEEFLPRSAPAFAGLDWQMDSTSLSSYTVLVIYAVVGNRLKLVYAKRYTGLEAADPDKIIEDVCEKFKRYGCSLIGCDWGVGHKENVRIAKGLGDRLVMECAYSDVKEGIRYQHERNVFMLDRTARMDNVFEAIRRKALWFPAWEQFEDWYMDIYTIYTDYNAIRRRRRFLHAAPDDFFHATVYAYEAAMKYYQYRLKLAA